MDSRTYFLLQLLQKLGAPLMAAVNRHGVQDDEAQAAQTMAALLSESVKIGIALSQSMNLKPGDGDADAIRVSLATLAGGLVAENYAQTGRIPGETESRRIQKSLEAVIVFADNFAPAAEHAQRLQTLDGTPPFFDSAQASLYSIHALLPVIGAVSEFSFGQEAAKLLQEIADHLGAKAKELQAGFTDSNTMGELVTLQALGRIYAAAHRAETARLSSAATDNAAPASLEAVWKSFDTQIAMITVLMKSMSGNASSSRGGSGGVKPAVEAAVPEEAAPPSPPPAAPSAASAPAGQAGSPMSFFKKK